MQIRIAQVHCLFWSLSVPHTRCSDQYGLRQNSPLHQGGLINHIKFYFAKFDDNKRNVLESKDVIGQVSSDFRRTEFPSQVWWRSRGRPTSFSSLSPSPFSSPGFRSGFCLCFHRCFNGSLAFLLRKSVKVLFLKTLSLC